MDKRVAQRPPGATRAETVAHAAIDDAESTHVLATVTELPFSNSSTDDSDGGDSSSDAHDLEWLDLDAQQYELGDVLWDIVLRSAP